MIPRPLAVLKMRFTGRLRSIAIWIAERSTVAKGICNMSNPASRFVNGGLNHYRAMLSARVL